MASVIEFLVGFFLCFSLYLFFTFFSNCKGRSCYCHIFVILKLSPAASVCPSLYMWKPRMGIIEMKVWLGKFVTYIADIKTLIIFCKICWCHTQIGWEGQTLEFYKDRNWLGNHWTHGYCPSPLRRKYCVNPLLNIKVYKRNSLPYLRSGPLKLCPPACIWKV